MSYRILGVLILLFVYSERIRRSAVFKENQKAISKNLLQIIEILLVVYWVSITLKLLNFYDVIYENVVEFLTTPRYIGTVAFTLWGIFAFILVVWASVVISRLVKYLMERQYLSSSQFGDNKKGAYILLIRYFILLFGFFLAIAAAGIPLDKVTIILGALSVGIGFGLQNIVNNLVSGFILALERPIQTGDIVEIGKFMGVVKDIGIRSSNVKTFDGAEVIVPNASFISNEVINWTLSNNHRRVEIMVGVAYGSNTQEVTKVLQTAIANHNEVMSIPPPMVLFHGFGDSSLDFRLLFWAKSMDNWLNLRSHVMEDIYQSLRDADIEIPFPQQDLHIKSDTSSPVQSNQESPLKRSRKDPTQKNRPHNRR